MSRIVVVTARAVACCAPFLAGPLAAQGPADAVFRVGETGLTLDFTELPGLEARTTGGGRTWHGRLGDAELTVTHWLLPKAEYGCSDPDDAADVARFNRDEEAAPFATAFLSGAFGELPYAVLLHGADGGGESFTLCGTTAESGYLLTVRASVPLGVAESKRVRAFFEGGIRYDGPKADPRWTDEEAEARWVEHTPEKLHRKLEIRRTEHFVILYNAGGELFGKKMEECYDRIRKIYPFDEVPGRRLMPVFLFRMQDEYVDYYSTIAGITREQAARSKGHAWRDYYATYYESPNDPVHVHEATHQIFKNRLRLGGGGSWFQEGVAEYMSEGKNEIKSTVRNLIREGEHMPFKKFMVVPSLLGSLTGSSVRGGSNAGLAYTQAASLIAFLRESRFGKRRFLDFVHAIGALPRGDLKGIEREIQRIYQVDIDGLEEQWRRHWSR